MKLLEDFEKKAFIWLCAGYLSTFGWLCILGMVQLMMDGRGYSWFGIFPVLNFVGFEVYFLWIIVVGKIKQMREK
jgi:uncharacterized membrane protein